ncbi:hypothetical protein PIROE2DRAFT_16350 [Piromyces sp. E2]|nr:hypothetical protein PIROE2DRAFT_16350 [Piromyces sp. E2]|eukprot:OUM58386.1 hypothetical protein PIROE2DRAFT_16350 [Piromyces sp. E2]
MESYLDEIKNIDITINKTSFFTNKCNYNGGIISIIDNNLIENTYNKSLNIDDSIYEDNSAKLFGGVIFVNSSDINISIKNSQFINNYAGVAGGITFSEKINPQIIRIQNKYLQTNNEFNNTLLNNNAMSHGNICATHPSKFIRIKDNNNIDKIHSGGSISLILELLDSFDNIVYDQEKYYSNIGIKTELFDSNKNKMNNSLIIDNGNVFNNGINKINSLKVFTKKPGEYYLKFSSKTSIHDSSNFEGIFYKINIDDCKSNTIKLFTPNELYYCEKPICHKSCQLLINYDCIKGKDNINDVFYNKCQCKKGWKGVKCDEKDFYDTNKYKLLHRILTLLLVLVMLLTSIFLVCSKRLLIVKDLGYTSFFLISLGCIMKNISNLYIMINSINDCILLFSLSSLGFILIYIPFTIKIIGSAAFSLNFDYSDKDYLKIINIFTLKIGKILFLSEKTTSSVNVKNDFFISKIDADFDQQSFKLNKSYSMESCSNPIYDINLINEKNNNKKQNYNCENFDQLFKKYIRKNYIKMIITVSLFIVFLAINIIYVFSIAEKSIIDTEMTNGLFAYKCPKEKMFLFIYVLEFILLMYDILSFQKIINARYIYLDCKVISIISLGWIVLDPGINVINIEISYIIILL